MDINSLVNVSITIGAASVDRASFGLALVAGHHTQWADLYRVYNSSTVLDSLVTEGFNVNSPVYTAVRDYISNTPRTPQIAVGRLSTAVAQTWQINVPASAVVEGKVISFDVVGPTGTTTTISHTVPGTPTTAGIATAIQAAINAISGITAAIDGSINTQINCTADVAGVFYRFPGLFTDLEFTDTTVATGLADNLAAIQTAFKGYYCLLTSDPVSAARATVIDTFISAHEKIALITARDIAAIIAVNASFRTAALYSQDWNKNAACSWAGECLPYDPGSQTWAYKTLPGVQPDNLSANDSAAILAAGGNIYVNIQGVNVTFEGRMGGGEFIDIIRFRDWLLARIREAVFAQLVSVRKIPFTDAGIQLIVTQVQSVLDQGVTVTGLKEDPAPVVTAPEAADVPAADRVDRLLPDIRFTAELAGAIHVNSINGVLSI